MNNKPLFTLLLLILFVVNGLASCSSPNEDITESINFIVDASDLNHDIDNSNNTITVAVKTNIDVNSWNAFSSAISWCKVTKAKDGKSIVIEADYNTTNKARQAIITVKSDVATYNIVVNQSSYTNKVNISQDIEVVPTKATDTDHQPGQDASHCIDGIYGGTAYHSTWSQRAAFPVSIDFTFNGRDSVNYLIYNTRSGNGNFGEVDIYVTADGGTERLYGSYDFHMQNAASQVTFYPALKNVQSIRFSVKSGLSDFVSCDEMDFYRYNPDNSMEKQLLKVFTDLSCSELVSDVSIDDIQALPEVFAKLALKLRDNTYDEWEKRFRIQTYSAYSIPEEWSSKLMTNPYSNLDNPTGIYANKGDTVMILVNETYGNNVAVQCINGIDVSGKTYFLKKGINLIPIQGESVSLYIMYNTDITSANAKPIKIQIPPGNGTVNGYFDLSVDKTDAKYANYLSKSTYKYFVVRGEKMMFCFHRSKMLEYAPNKILSAINLWDNMVKWQQKVCGIEAYKSQFNNHMYAVSTENGYMSATSYRVNFIYTYLGNILLKENVMANDDNAWGPAHEIGHMHQDAINWRSCTESSNNLFSNYTICILGKYTSRGGTITKLAEQRMRDDAAWYLIDNELKMRMFWQLFLYFHTLTDENGKTWGCGVNNEFWPTLFNLMRDNRLTNGNSRPGEKQLLFATMASRAANVNLTEFFETWGLLTPVDNVTIDDYGSVNLNVTQQMIDDAKAEMATYPSPSHCIQYIEDRYKGMTEKQGIGSYSGQTGFYTTYKNNLTVGGSPKYTVSSNTITVTDCTNAVALEVYVSDKLVYFANTYSFAIPSTIDQSNMSVKAVQADGTRINIVKN